ncbi:methyl-accepting chemotaxis protein, partial [Piscinibacter sakaiensis]|uniref:methyl-accepting chemotaxis protein n=1 Tax=Piscinibacter sakaiensis TaxID=1547922 RepID=UPI0006B58568
MPLTAALFRPGMQLMRHLRVPTKMALMGTFLIVPLALLVALTAQHTQADLRFVDGELEGTRLVRAISGAVDRVQWQRDLTMRVLSGDAAAQAPQQAARVELQQAITALDAAVEATPGTDVGAAWKDKRAALAALAEGRHAKVRTAAFDEHAKAVQSLRQLLLLAAERSGLVLDPEPVTFFLMDVAVERVLPWAELIAATRGQVSATLARGDVSNTERVQLLGRMDALELHLADTRMKLDALERSGGRLPPGTAAAFDGSRAFIGKVRAVLGADAILGEPGPFFDDASRALQAVVDFDRQVIGELELQLGARRDASVRLLAIELAVSAGGVALVLYLALSFYFSFRGALGALRKGVAAAGSGDLAHRTEVKGRDELAEIGQMLEAMNGRLSAMVAEIRSSAVRVGQAGHQVAGSSESLSQRTEEQAASLRQTVATVAQLSAAVAANADSAQELDRMTGSLRVQAEAGGEAMRQTVSSMGQLESSSRRVAEIIGVI